MGRPNIIPSRYTYEAGSDIVASGWVSHAFGL